MSPIKSIGADTTPTDTSLCDFSVSPVCLCGESGFSRRGPRVAFVGRALLAQPAPPRSPVQSHRQALAVATARHAGRSRVAAFDLARLIRQLDLGRCAVLPGLRSSDTVGTLAAGEAVRCAARLRGCRAGTGI